MAQFLTLDGNPIPVVRNSARELEPRRQGVERELFSGDLVNTYRAHRRDFECSVGYKTSSAMESFRASISGAAQPGIPKSVTMSGEWLDGASLTVLPKLGAITTEMRGEGPTATLFYVGTLTLKQISD